MKNELKTTVWVIVERGVSFLIGILVSGILARQLGQETFGIWLYLLELSSLFGAFTSLFPADVIMPRLIFHRGREFEILSCTLLGRTVFSCLGAIIFAVVCFWQLHDQNGLVLMISVAAFRLATDEPVSTLTIWLLSRGQARITAISGIVGVSARGATVLVIAKVVGSEPEWTTIAWLVEIIFLTAYMYVAAQRADNAIRPRLTRPSIAKMIRLIQPGVSIMLSVALYSLLYRIDKIVLQPRLPADVFGQYMACYQISGNVAMLPPLVARAVVPLVMYRRGAIVRPFIWFGICMTGATILMCGIVSAFSTNIMLIVFGISFGETGGLLSKMIWICVPSALDSVLAAPLYRVGAGWWTLLKWGGAVAAAGALGFGVAANVSKPELGIWIFIIGYSTAISINVVAIWRTKALGKDAIIKGY